MAEDRAHDPKRVPLRAGTPSYDPRTWSSMGYRADDPEHSPNPTGAGSTGSKNVVGITPEGN